MEHRSVKETFSLKAFLTEIEQGVRMLWCMMKYADTFTKKVNKVNKVHEVDPMAGVYSDLRELIFTESRCRSDSECMELIQYTSGVAFPVQTQSVPVQQVCLRNIYD